MRPLTLAAVLAFLAQTATAQVTAGLSAGYLFSSAPGVRASCGRSAAITADAWAARPLDASGRLTALVAARWVRPLEDVCPPIGGPLPIRPDGASILSSCCADVASI